MWEGGVALSLYISHHPPHPTLQIPHQLDAQDGAVRDLTGGVYFLTRSGLFALHILPPKKIDREGFFANPYATVYMRPMISDRSLEGSSMARCGGGRLASLGLAWLASLLVIILTCSSSRPATELQSFGGKVEGGEGLPGFPNDEDAAEGYAMQVQQQQ